MSNPESVVSSYESMVLWLTMSMPLSLANQTG